MRLLYAELLKIRTAPRTTIGLVLGLLLLVGAGSAATASSADSSPFERAVAVRDVISVASVAPIFTLILGILIVTWEYRHGTITPTFLVTPKRERVIGAKLTAALLTGVVLTIAALVVGLIVAVFWISVDPERGHWELMGRIVFAAGLWGALGAGLGALLQSQVGAIVTSFVWFLVAEPLLGVTIDALTDNSIGDYFPGSVLDRLQATGEAVELGGEAIDDAQYPYGLWAAALMATAYTAAMAALGLASAVRRDVP